MRHHPHVTGSAEHTAASSSAPATSRWLLLAVALCGALAGGSIVEAIAAMASRASMPVAPDHLIAEPLALAGALCGGLLAAIVAGKDQRKRDAHADILGETLPATESIPGEPMMWQPTPPTLPGVQMLTSADTPTDTPSISQSLRHTPHIHRTIRRYRPGHHAPHAAFLHPPTQP